MLIDGHGEAASLLETDRCGRHRRAGILLTHHHGDHVDIAEYERFDVPVLASRRRPS